MGKSNFSEDLKRDAVRQITERGYPVAEVSQRLGVSQHSLYEWTKKFVAPNAKGSDEAEEIRRLKKEFLQLSVLTMGRLLRVHPSGFYAWLKNPLSRRASEDKRQTDLLLKAWEESGKVYGYRKLHDDLLDQGEMCCPNRVAHLTRLAGIKAQIGYKRRPGIYGGRPSVVIGLHARPAIRRGGSGQGLGHRHHLLRGLCLPGRRHRSLFPPCHRLGNAEPPNHRRRLQALLMAVWRRKPKDKVLIHSDQGSQFTSMDWASFLKHHNLVHSMSRRGNCHDNAVAESFFNLLKRERIRRKVYRSRADARQDVFDYIEMFYNPKRKHVRNGMLSPVEFEKQQKL